MTHPTTNGRYLTTRFSDALRVAAELHASQKRKKDDRVIPYVSHLLAVSSYVLEDDGTEDQAIAGLLHDAVEDQGLAEQGISDEFGAEVARIVIACSDAVAKPGDVKPPWLERKLHHLAKLRALGHDVGVLRVTAADKLHNCRDIVADVEEQGVDRLERFNGGVGGTLLYYGAMSELLGAQFPESRLTNALRIEAGRLHELAAVEYPAPQPPSVP